MPIWSACLSAWPIFTSPSAPPCGNGSWVPPGSGGSCLSSSSSWAAARTGTSATASTARNARRVGLIDRRGGPRYGPPHPPSLGRAPAQPWRASGLTQDVSSRDDLRRRLGAWQLDDESRRRTPIAHELDRAAVGFGHLPRDGEPEPRAPGLRREERLEHPLLQVDGNADSVVRHVDLHRAAVRRHRSDDNRTVASLKGVGEQVREDLGEQHGIAEDRGDRVLERKGRPVARKRRDDVLKQQRNRYRL